MRRPLHLRAGLHFLLLTKKEGSGVRVFIERHKIKRYNGYIWGFPLYNQTVNGTLFNLSVKFAGGYLSETDLPDSLVTDALGC